MTKDELVARLKKLNGQGNPELAREALEHLREEFDVELVDLIENAFGVTVDVLYRQVYENEPDDLASTLSLSTAWIGAYLKLTNESESPQIFHCMAALAAVGSMWGKSAWINLGYTKVYPPMAVLLVGPSGVRKSAAISQAIHLLEYSDVHIFKDRFTLEGIISSVKDGSRTLLVASEFAATFGKAKYLEDAVPVMTRMLDQEGIEYTTKTAGKFKLRNVAFGLLAASTAEWIHSGLPQSAVNGGFLGRFIIAFAPRPTKCVYKAADVSTNIEALGNGISEFARSIRGEIVLEPDADAWLARWYRSTHGDVFAIGPAMASYYNRRLVHLVRMALVLALGSGSSSVTVKHVRDAYKILTEIEPGHLQVLAEVAGANTYRDLVTLLSSFKRTIITKEHFVHIGTMLFGHRRFREAVLAGMNMGVISMQGDKYKITMGKAPDALRKVVMAKKGVDNIANDVLQ